MSLWGSPKMGLEGSWTEETELLLLLCPSPKVFCLQCWEAGLNADIPSDLK